jgi:hypothetical protein
MAYGRCELERFSCGRRDRHLEARALRVTTDEFLKNRFVVHDE